MERKEREKQTLSDWLILAIMSLIYSNFPKNSSDENQSLVTPPVLLFTTKTRHCISPQSNKLHFFRILNLLKKFSLSFEPSNQRILLYKRVPCVFTSLNTIFLAALCQVSNVTCPLSSDDLYFLPTPLSFISKTTFLTLVQKYTFMLTSLRIK